MIGQTLGHYRVVEKIGAGGMGDVYRAHDERLDRDVALKVLPAGTLANEAARKRFRKEALVLAKLNHPNIETVYDFDTQDGVDFLVMELIAGTTLRDKLAAGPLGEKTTFRLGVQLAEGLAAAHARGVVHRDLKPGNLIATPDGYLKILDFGLARLFHPASDMDLGQSTTESQAPTGTLPYMSPEQLLGEPVDERNDIYAGGAVLYEMATGQPPFPESHGPRLIDAILHQSPKPPSELSRRVSPVLESIILKALDKDPERRYQSARELRVDLQRLASPMDLPTLSPTLDHTQIPTLEMAHVLFMDIVGYSKLPMDEQQKVLRQLQRLVRGTAQFARAQANDELIRLPTGDGMALVFFNDPEAPVRCALELSRALKSGSGIQLRMGVHTGPVYRVADINANRNVAGGGINIAQRVMDCGDAGHILVSKAVADVLGQVSTWASLLHDLGEAEVKHGVRVHLLNVFDAEVGNPELPQKLRTAASRSKPKTVWQELLARRWAVAAALGALAVLGLVIDLKIGGRRDSALRRLHPESESAGLSRGVALNVKPRPAVAVLGFKNLSGRADEAWLSTALSEMLTTELAAGEQLRCVPGEEVANMKINLSLSDADSYGTETLSKIRKNLGADDVVLGSYIPLGKGEIRLDLRLQDAGGGETLVAISEKGSEAQVDDLVNRAGAALREKLGAGQVTLAEAAAVKASLPSNPEAARFYSEGLAKLRVFDDLAARDLLEKAVAIEPLHALSHSALAQAWSGLGYEEREKEEAQKAFELSSGSAGNGSNLSRQARLWVEGRYRESTKEWDKAVEVYRALWDLAPDDLEVGLHLASAQAAARQQKDALGTVEALRELPAPESDDPRIDLMEVRAIGAGSLGSSQEEAAAALKAAEKARAQGKRLVTAEALYTAGVFSDLGPAERRNAMAKEEEAKEIYAATGDRFGVAKTVEIIANIYFERGNLKEASRAHKEALEIYREIGNQYGVVGELWYIARDLRKQGDSAGEKKTYYEALAVVRKINDKAEQLDVLALIAFWAFREGDLAGLEKACREAQTIVEQTGEKREHFLDFPFEDLGEVLQMKGDLTGARTQYEKALAVWIQTGDKREVACARLDLAELAVEDGHPADAEPVIRETREELRKEEWWAAEAFADTLLARTLLEQAKPEEARKELDNAKPLVAKMADPDFRGRDLAIAMARIRTALGEPDEAENILPGILAKATKQGVVPWQFEARLALGEAEMKAGKVAAGRARLAALEKDATAKGFMLIARKATAAAK